MDDKKKLTKEHELHKRKSETFYERKRNVRKKAATNDQFAGLAFDFQKIFMFRSNLLITCTTGASCAVTLSTFMY